MYYNLIFKTLSIFSVNNNKENKPITANARYDPLENVKSKFNNESIKRNVFVLFSIKYFFDIQK